MTAISISSLSRPSDVERPNAPPTPGADGGFGRTLAAAIESKLPVLATTVVDPVLLGELERQETMRRDREAGKRGKALLEALTALQRLTLESGDEGGVLDHMATLLHELPQAADPGLGRVVKEIAVRAAVEIARRERGDRPK